MALVVDSNVIVAALDAAEPEHAECLRLLMGSREDLVVPAPVLVEVNYWIRKRHGVDGWVHFVEDIANGAYRVHDLDSAGLLRAAHLDQAYANLDLGLVDASVVVTCETLGETKVATLDRRDFSVVRPRHCDALTILPE